ncbi:MAG: hypothetical protein GC168_03110 [Candidatus Hydrogenedens sp.]|nr:hypothetical protein [Candidatus Hydrogenedens sp.]
MSSAEFEEVPRLSNPDPFAPARNLRTALREGASKLPGDRVRYLWLLVSQSGIELGECAKVSARPTVEQWLNVIDEAASIGVGRLVISAQTELSEHAEVWELCRWAQDAHGMSVGVHIFSCQLSENDLEELKSLAPEKTVLFVSDSNYACMQHLESDGVRVCVAQRMPEKPQHPCGMPSEMVFVNPRGELYTCGMVEGAQSYRLGSIFEGFLSKICCDPNLPHAVPVDSQDENRGCEGCPPLLARYFYDER